MPSTTPLVFDRTKFDKYEKGDLGIADKIYTEDILPKQPTAEKTPKNGIWANEKTILQVFFELNKPLIELNKHYLALQGHIEYIMVCLSGGPNPYNLSTTKLYAYTQNIGDMNKFKTGYDAASLKTAGQTEVEQAPPKLPEYIFIGYYNKDGGVKTPNAQENHFKLPGYNSWPQYKTKNEYTTEQTTKINNDTATVEEPYKSIIRKARVKGFDKEWEFMEKENSMSKLDIPKNIKYAFKPITTTYLNKQIDIDIETDYALKINSKDDEGNIYILATLKPGINAPTPSANSGGTNSSQNSKIKQQPDPIPTSSYPLAAKHLFNKTLKMMLKDYIPLIIKMKLLLAKPDKYAGDLLTKYIIENFESFDKDIQNKPLLKNKYYSDDIFLFDGQLAVNVDKFKCFLNVNSGHISFKSSGNVDNEQNSIKYVMYLTALSVNYCNQMIDVYAKVLESIFDITQIPAMVTNLFSLADFKKVVLPNNLIKMAGGKGTDLLTIPAYEKQEGADMKDTEQNFKKVTKYFINEYINLINIVYNTQLATKLP